jgi:rubrerythrin
VKEVIMTVEEAIKTAIEYESKVKRVYVEAEQNAIDEVGKRVFKTMADEEQSHIDYLNERLSEWKKTGKITPVKLKTVVPTREAIRKGIDDLKEKMSAKDHGKELDMLRKAYSVEQETSNFYIRMVEELEDEGQRMFADFVEIEKGHLDLVQAEIDAVSGFGYWFDMREFNLEAY